MLERILNNLKQYSTSECFQIKDKIYTYKQLYRYVCNIYTYLLVENKNKKPVIIYGHKDIHMLASLLACAFAGMAYVPIDISISEERKKYIIDLIKPNIIIDDKIENIMNNENYSDIDKIYMKPEDLYYIIFTSGSTGNPKGVKVLYKNVISCVNWLEEITNIEKGIVLNQANFSFDLSVADIYLNLISGSKHYIIERETQKDYIKLFKELKNSNATIAVITPSFADLLLLDKTFDKNLMPNLKTIIFCGEKLLNKTVDKLYKRFEDIKIINCYGPTECTFAITSIELSNENLENEISIGVPKQDVDIFIVNENNEILKENEIGQIVVCGESVAAGYIQADIENNGFRNFNGKKCYYTGDFGYWKNNQIYYVGRQDKQIKFKGYRIEINDIENALYQLKNIEKAVVTTTKNKLGSVNKIIAFVKLKDNQEQMQLKIKPELLKLLPDYMIPNIKIVHNIPLNINGKVDIKKLLEEYT